jgi:hypothetical protein
MKIALQIPDNDAWLVAALSRQQVALLAIEYF